MPGKMTRGEPEGEPDSHRYPFSTAVGRWAKRVLGPPLGRLLAALDAAAGWWYGRWRAWYEKRYDPSMVSRAPRLARFVSEALEGWRRVGGWAASPAAAPAWVPGRRLADRLRAEGRACWEWNASRTRTYFERVRPYASQAWAAMRDYWNSPSRDFVFSWKRTGDVLSGRKLLRLDRGAMLRVGLVLSMGTFLYVDHVRRPLLRDLTGIACFAIWQAGPEAMPERDVRLIKMKYARRLRDGLYAHYDRNGDGAIRAQEEAALVKETGLSLDELTRKDGDSRLAQLVLAARRSPAQWGPWQTDYDADGDGRYDEAELGKILEDEQLSGLRARYATADLLEFVNAAHDAKYVCRGDAEESDVELPAGLALDPTPTRWGDGQLYDLVRAAHKAGILAEIATKHHMTPTVYVFDDAEDAGAIYGVIARTAWLTAQQPYQGFKEQTWAEINDDLRIRWRPADDYFKSRAQLTYQRAGHLPRGEETPKNPEDNTRLERLQNLVSLVRREGWGKLAEVPLYAYVYFRMRLPGKMAGIPGRHPLIEMPLHLEWPRSLEAAVEEPPWVVETRVPPSRYGHVTLQADAGLAMDGDCGAWQTVD